MWSFFEFRSSATVIHAIECETKKKEKKQSNKKIVNVL